MRPTSVAATRGHKMMITTLATAHLLVLTSAAHYDDLASSTAAHHDDLASIALHTTTSACQALYGPPLDDHQPLTAKICWDSRVVRDMEITPLAYAWPPPASARGSAAEYLDAQQNWFVKAE